MVWYTLMAITMGYLRGPTQARREGAIGSHELLEGCRHGLSKHAKQLVHRLSNRLPHFGPCQRLQDLDDCLHQDKAQSSPAAPQSCISQTSKHPDNCRKTESEVKVLCGACTACTLQGGPVPESHPEAGQR